MSQFSCVCIVRQTPESEAITQAIRSAGYRARSASNSVPDVISTVTSTAGRNVVAFLCSAAADPGSTEAGDFVTRVHSASKSFRTGYILLPYSFAPSSEAVALACRLPNMTVIYCSSPAAYPSTIVQLIAGSSCPQVRVELENFGMSISSSSSAQLERLNQVRRISFLPDALLSVTGLGVSERAAEALASLGAMADVAQCSSANELVACTGLDESSAVKLVELWHTTAYG